MDGASAAPKPLSRPTAVTIAEFLVVVVCTLAFAFTLFGILHSLLQQNAAGQRDFVEYWSAGQLLAHHADPYDPASLLLLERSAGLPADSSVMVLPNPPIALPLLAPLGYLPPLPAELLWCSFLLVALLASVVMVRRLHGRKPGVFDLLAYFFAPVLLSMEMGQMSMLVLLGLAAFLFWNRSRPIIAGCALCLCALKPHLLLPFGLVLLIWAIQGRRYRLLYGAAIGALITGAVAIALDPHAFADYSRMMAAARVDKVPIPCLSNALRRAIAPDAMWLQYLPAALGSLWALDYYRRNRAHWDWLEHGSLLTLVSFAVAPYSWMTDQAVLVPALLHGLYVTRSRVAIALFALANVVIQLNFFHGVTRLLHSPWYLWTAPAWLVWYCYAIRAGRAKEKFAPSLLIHGEAAAP